MTFDARMFFGQLYWLVRTSIMKRLAPPAPGTASANPSATSNANANSRPDRDDEPESDLDGAEPS